jgi:lipopolysaccharide export LptBFGC system permease protein LptF
MMEEDAAANSNSANSNSANSNSNSSKPRRINRQHKKKGARPLKELPQLAQFISSPLFIALFGLLSWCIPTASNSVLGVAVAVLGVAVILYMILRILMHKVHIIIILRLLLLLLGIRPKKRRRPPITITTTTTILWLITSWKMDLI